MQQMSRILGIMLCLASLACVPALKAVEPFQVTVTDTERDIYMESVDLASDRVTPDCPHAWSVRKHVLRGGRQEGVDVIDVDNGRLRFRVVPTRGMSLQKAMLGDVRLGWDSPVRDLVHPKLLDLESRQGLGWLEGFNEWVVRCGLEFFGAPGMDEFIDNTGNKARMDLTLHGKIGNIPASFVQVTVDRSPPYTIRVRGRVDETCMHGPKLELWAEISTQAGSDSLRISDKITNRSAKEQEFGVLYHANYGPPLMEQDAKFIGPVKRVVPINALAAAGLSTYDVYRGPTPGVAERVYCLWLWADPYDRTKVMLRNARGDKAVVMAFSVKELPYFTIWKNPVALEDGYVTGLEPGTGFSRNRSIERRAGRVPVLKPHESRTFTLDFLALADSDRIADTAREIQRIQGDRPTQIDNEPLPVE
ncbi:MAG: aldose 1-epimerase family protein [Sedimentisphaerales bacterium]|nr:aldose 1-epimerase family protein [Sedimentisphaerales bacterium]